MCSLKEKNKKKKYRKLKARNEVGYLVCLFWGNCWHLGTAQFVKVLSTGGCAKWDMVMDGKKRGWPKQWRKEKWNTKRRKLRMYRKTYAEGEKRDKRIEEKM